MSITFGISKNTFAKILYDVIEQAREQKDGHWITHGQYKYTRREIAREALENFEDELEETKA